MWGFALVTIGTALWSADEQRQAGKEAKKISKQNAARIQSETDESIRKAKLDQNKILAETRARAAASGIGFDSASVSSYLNEMKSNFDKELDWAKKSGTSAANLEIKKGGQAQSMANSNAWGTIGQGISSAGSFL